MNISFNNNQEAIQALKIIQEYLESNVVSNSSKVIPYIVNEKHEKLFLELLNELKFNENLDAWFDIDENCVIEIHKENKRVWFNYNKFYLQFDNEFNLRYVDVDNLLSAMAEKYLGLKDYYIFF